jgi:undecaprenyl-diphosphatase
MLEQLLHYDKTCFLYLNSLGCSFWDPFWLFITNKWSFVPMYVFLLYIFFFSEGLKKGFAFIATVILLILLTDQCANIFKYGFERLRPCHNPEIQTILRLVKESCGGKYGFYSAHASNSFSIAMLFVCITKYKLRFLLLVWASFVAYSRIYVGVHYPLDVICGTIIGVTYGFLFCLFFNLLIKKVNFFNKS